jgi:co-chaperonin GroES (HSP10)
MKSIGIKPAKNVIILRSASLKTKSGLQAVESEKNAPEIGEIVAIGLGTPPLKISIGDIIVYRKYMENKVYIPKVGEELNFVDFKEIVANLGKN